MRFDENSKNIDFKFKDFDAKVSSIFEILEQKFIGNYSEFKNQIEKDYLKVFSFEIQKKEFENEMNKNLKYKKFDHLNFEFKACNFMEKVTKEINELNGKLNDTN